MSLTLPIIIGKRYVRRDGQIVTVRERHPNIDDDQVYAGSGSEVTQDSHEHVDARTGLVYRSQKYAADLVADHIEMTAHPHAALMLQYAQDAAETAEPWLRWQGRLGKGDIWLNLSIHPGWVSDQAYRRKPKTIRIGEFDVPEPLRQHLDQGADYWLVDLVNGAEAVRECSNFTPSTALTHIALGLVHLTRDAAELHARALLSFTEQK